MEITDFTEKIQQSNADSSVRLTAQLIKSMLANDCGLKEFEVKPQHFDRVLKATGAKEITGCVFRFIRIQDMAGNSVDIQTRK